MRQPRREFLRTTALAAASFPIAVPGLAKAPPSERVRVALIGAGGRGRGLVNAFASEPDVEITHVCDADRTRAAEVAEEIGKTHAKSPAIEQDLRRVFDDKSVDAVVIATPDHWHALATVWACQAGKHVYVEKPASQTLWEGRQMVAAARKYDRRVQVGTQSRSAPHYLEMVKALREGKIGTLLTAKAWNSQRRPNLSDAADSSPPEGVDYNLWLGAAPERPFNPNRFHYAWHWMWDYGTGDIGNDGIHDLDIARWGLGAALPNRVACMGHRLVNDRWETPDSFTVAFEFESPKQVLTFEQRDWSPYVQEGYENGTAFYGTEGYILAGRSGWRLFRGNQEQSVSKLDFSDAPHRRNFLDAIKSGTTLNADIEEGHRSAVLAHLANIAYRTGSYGLNFDPATEMIVGNDSADALRRRAYRAPFVIPDAV